MKRLIILLIVVIMVIWANPIDPKVHLSEVQVRSSGDWTIELHDAYGTIAYYDSICVEGKIGSRKISHLDTTEYMLITQENISDSIRFGMVGDNIRIHFYRGGDPNNYTDSVLTGLYEGSYLHNIDTSQSLATCRNGYLFFKDNTPTLGSANTYEGSLGMICGYFYDYDGSPLSGGAYFDEFGVGVYADPMGYYEVELPSRYYYLDSFYSNMSSLTQVRTYYQPVEFELEPDSCLRIDFYKLETSIIPIIKNNIVKLNNYPHPASSYTWLFIDNTDVEASAMRVNVYALNGRKVDSFIPTAKQFRYNCMHLPQGSYVLTLSHGHEVLATKKLQILK